METFIEHRELVENEEFQEQKKKSLRSLIYNTLDAPIINLIKHVNELPYCFTLQSCFGHFLYNNQKDIHNLETLPVNGGITTVDYRIAYICLCIDNCASGERLIHALKEITKVDPKNIQFGCAEWFWKRQTNSYVLQVEPERFKHSDRAVIDHNEALQIEKVRNQFYKELEKMVSNEISGEPG